MTLHELLFICYQIYEKQRLEEAKEQLEFMKYHPLHVPIEIVSRVDDPGINRKKLKKHITG